MTPAVALTTTRIRRLARLRRLLHEQGLSAALLIRSEHLRYFAGTNGGSMPAALDATTKRAANPFQAEAPKTIAYEIVARLGDVPDWVVVPVGGGATLFGIWRGFQDLARAGRIFDRLPRLAAVQPARFNTLEVALARGLQTSAELAAIAMDEDVETVLRNLKHGIPPDAPDALRALRESGGLASSVSDEAARLARARLGREEGFFCEPSAAAGVAAKKPSPGRVDWALPRPSSAS